MPWSASSRSQRRSVSAAARLTGTSVPAPCWSVFERRIRRVNGVRRRGESRSAAARAGVHTDRAVGRRGVAAPVPGAEGNRVRDQAVHVRRRLEIDPRVVMQDQRRASRDRPRELRPGSAVVGRIPERSLKRSATARPSLRTTSIPAKSSACMVAALMRASPRSAGMRSTASEPGTRSVATRQTSRCRPSGRTTVARSGPRGDGSAATSRHWP